MNPFEESIPEEQKGKQAKLTMLLRQAYHQEPTLPEREQQEAIIRVAERLRKREEEQTALTEKPEAQEADGFALRPR